MADDDDLNTNFNLLASIIFITVLNMKNLKKNLLVIHEVIFFRQNITLF